MGKSTKVKQKSMTLYPDDAAIILRSDGTFETIFPEVDSETVPDNAMLGAAIAYALQNPEMCEVLLKHFYVTSQEIGDSTENITPIEKRKKFTPSVV